MTERQISHLTESDRIGDIPLATVTRPVVVLTEQVADAHVAGLRADGVSYVLAGNIELDIASALETLYYQVTP